MDKLTEIIPSFGIHLAPSKGKVMLQDVLGLNTPLTLQEIFEVVDRFTYLESCVSTDCSISNEIYAQISKARITFANLCHLWRQKGISLSLKGRVYKTIVQAVLL